MIVEDKSTEIKDCDKIELASKMGVEVSEPAGSVETHARGSDFWGSSRGKSARVWFEAWGLTVRGRIDTGDPAYVPQMDSVPGGSGSNRSHPSNVADVLLRFVAVEAALLKAPVGMRRLAHFAFVAGQTTRQYHRPIFKDKTFGDWERGPSPEPGPLVAGFEEVTRTAWDWDLARYPATPLDLTFAANWELDLHALIVKRFDGLGKFVAGELNL